MVLTLINFVPYEKKGAHIKFNNNQQEVMLLQDITNHTEFKFPHFKDYFRKIILNSSQIIIM